MPKFFISWDGVTDSTKVVRLYLWASGPKIKTCFSLMSVKRSFFFFCHQWPNIYNTGKKGVNCSMWSGDMSIISIIVKITAILTDGIPQWEHVEIKMGGIKLGSQIWALGYTTILCSFVALFNSLRILSLYSEFSLSGCRVEIKEHSDLLYQRQRLDSAPPALKFLHVHPSIFVYLFVILFYFGVEISVLKSTNDNTSFEKNSIGVPPV